MRTGEVEIGRWRVVAAASWELSRLIALMRGRRGLTWPQGRDHVFQEPPTGPGALHQFNTCCSLVVPLCSLVQNFNDISTGNRVLDPYIRGPCGGYTLQLGNKHFCHRGVDHWSVKTDSIHAFGKIAVICCLSTSKSSEQQGQGAVSLNKWC